MGSKTKSQPQILPPPLYDTQYQEPGIPGQISGDVRNTREPLNLNLQNLITLEGALDLVGKAKGAGLFNLDQDLDLQNL